jgi:hypothetical protein
LEEGAKVGQEGPLEVSAEGQLEGWELLEVSAEGQVEGWELLEVSAEGQLEGWELLDETCLPLEPEELMEMLWLPLER